MTSTRTVKSENDTSVVPPFLKWAGGKRWLTSKLVEMFPSVGSISGTYYEPFLGSGAMFFHLRPRRAVLNDINIDLINTYRAIKKSPMRVARLLEQYDASHSTRFYYCIRASMPKEEIRAAARFVYLNRTCWNGLYRVNRQGDFNVPIGTKTSVVLLTDDFQAISKRLIGVSLQSRDFAAIIAQAGEGDVVFADPPYTVNHNLNGFLKYNEELFSWDDQTRLHAAVVAAAERGARVIVCNANHSSLRKLYRESVFHLSIIRRHSKLSGSNAGRKAITELVISSAM